MLPAQSLFYLGSFIILPSVVHKMTSWFELAILTTQPGYLDQLVRLGKKACLLNLAKLAGLK